MPLEPREPSQSPSALYSYRFANVEFNEASFQLLVGGRPVDVQRKPLEVLALLLRHVGEVVTKDELLESVWSGTLPVENVVANAVNKLRSALGEQGGARIVTQARVGYRLSGPIDRIAVGRSFTSQLELRADMPVPFRLNFQLSELLGQSESNEVWVGVHSKTGEQRVYKFSKSGSGLSALKREATLQRYLSSTLGVRDDIARLIDWNFDEAPFFLESAYGGTNLLQWAGGPNQPLARLAPAQRVALFVQICAIVAAAHGVGVLHKDLKPTNVLVRRGSGPDTWKVALADFGSARLTDPKRLEELSITQLGHTVLDDPSLDSRAATLLYAAPELFAGGVPTTQSDVYALGILLYQMVVGDIRRPLHSGWERDIQDELLRADIAEATDGEASRRLSGAAALLDRLTGLEARRLALEHERTEARRHALEAAQYQRSRARRPWIIAAGVVLLLGLVVSLGFYLDARRATREAEAQAARADAINRFLNDDILAAADPGSPGATSNPRMLDVLEAARERIDVVVAEAPDTRASIRLALAKAYAALSDLESSEIQLDKVLKDLTGADPADSTRLLAQYERVKVLIEMGRHDDARKALEEADLAAGARLREDSRIALAALTAHGDYLHGTGQHAQAFDYYRRAEALRERIAPNDELEWIRLRVYAADSLYFLNRLDESVAMLRPFRTMDHALERFGARYWALAGAVEGRSLGDGGHLEEGDAVLTAALRVMKEHVGARNQFTLAVENELGNMKVLLGRPLDALPLYRESYEATREGFGADSTPALTAQANLARLALIAGDAKGALRDLQTASDGIRRRAGDQFPQLQEVNLMLAEALLANHRPEDALRVVNSLDRTYPQVEGAQGPFDAQIDALKGQILHAQGRREEGRALIKTAIERMTVAHAAPSVVESFRTKLAKLAP